jgi:hypothetical protein
MPTDDSVDRLQYVIDEFDAAELIRSFDVRFDIPFQHDKAIGLLEMKGAFAPVEPGVDEERQRTVRVGAYWCRIVSDDVRFDLAHGLAAIERSRADAELLREGGSKFAAYAATRWADGAGKVLYRTGSYARGRILFEDAARLATDRDLWWCLADVRSNFLRAQLQEAQLAGRPVTESVDDFLQEIERQEQVAYRKRLPLLPPLQDTAVPERESEFRRGYFSLLHNLSIAQHRSGDAAGSLETAERVFGLAEASNDEYRQAQALLQRVQLIMATEPSTTRAAEARRLLKTLAKLRWGRGQRIAMQQLAVLDGGVKGIRALLALIRSTTDDPSVLTGLDVESDDIAARRALELVPGLPEAAQREIWTAQIRKAQLAVSRSVRQVIALPGYQRSYSQMMRPVYLAGMQPYLDANQQSDTSDVERWEGALGLVEEYTGRELLDLMSSTTLPLLDAPPTRSSAPAAGAGGTLEIADDHVPVRDEEGSDGDRGDEFATTRGGFGRRSRPRRANTAGSVKATMLDREREFESQFLRNPLRATPHDPEIARKAEGFVINNPGTCIVRYFRADEYDSEKKVTTKLWAFVIRHGLQRPVACWRHDEVRQLADRLARLTAAPTTTDSRQIWKLLLDPVWASIAPLGHEPDHLVIIPSDELFAVPFHIAAPEGELPLGARVPLSQSVSLAAFLLRSRSHLRRQRVEQNDDLAAMVLRDGKRVSGQEILLADWPAEHLHLAGDAPECLHLTDRPRRADWSGLKDITESKPEFFVYAGHGYYLPEYGELGPYLEMTGPGQDGTELLTPFDVALRIRMPRNRLTVLGACVAGQGAQTAGGDVAGFLRGFIAAGAGAIALPLWRVLDDAVATTTGHLLRASRQALKPPSNPEDPNGNGVFDVVSTLQRHYRLIVEYSVEQGDEWIDRLPLSLYT